LDNFKTSPDSRKSDLIDSIVCDFEKSDCDWKASAAAKADDLQWFVTKGVNKTQGSRN